LRYTASLIKQEPCHLAAARLAYASSYCLKLAVNPLLVVLPHEATDLALPEVLQRALAGIDASPTARATCLTMVSQAQELAPREIVMCVPALTQDLLDVLQAWSGTPPCPLSLVSAALDRQSHEKLAALGVHAWESIEVLTSQSLDALLGRAHARWQRENGLRTELVALRTRLDERKWIDRAKGL